MKKIINGKKYDTETARLIGSARSDCGRADFGYWEESLYQKRTGEFFVAGSGGAASDWSTYISHSERGPGGGIKPLEEFLAREWVETHLDAEEYEELFGEVGE